MNPFVSKEQLKDSLLLNPRKMFAYKRMDDFALLTFLIKKKIHRTIPHNYLIGERLL